MPDIRVAITDDHYIVRQGIRALLEGLAGYTIVGEATNGREALQLVNDTRPDILILDIMLPDLSGIDIAEHVKRRSPQTRIVMLSMYLQAAYVARAMSAGASAYVHKGTSGADMIAAIEAAAARTDAMSALLSVRTRCRSISTRRAARRWIRTAG